MIYNESEESHAWFIKLYFILNLIDAKLKSGIHLFNLYFRNLFLGAKAPLHLARVSD